MYYQLSVAFPSSPKHRKYPACQTWGRLLNFQSALGAAPTRLCKAFATKPSTTDPRLEGAGAESGGHDCAGGVLPPPHEARPRATKRRLTTARGFRPRAVTKMLKRKHLHSGTARTSLTSLIGAHLLGAIAIKRWAVASNVPRGQIVAFRVHLAPHRATDLSA